MTYPRSRFGIQLCLLTALLLLLPTLAQAASTEDGKTLYKAHCQRCHGEAAKGDGTDASRLKAPPADLTRISARSGGEYPFDEVFKAIDGRAEVKGHGSREMPVWGKAFKGTEETGHEVVKEKITALARYLKLMQVE